MSPPSPHDETYCFRLYIAGASELKSVRAIANFYRLAERIPGTCDVEIVDIYEQIEDADADRITATPTLVKVYPPPVQKFVGDLSEIERVLSVLRIKHDR